MQCTTQILTDIGAEAVIAIVYVCRDFYIPTEALSAAFFLCSRDIAPSTSRLQTQKDPSFSCYITFFLFWLRSPPVYGISYSFYYNARTLHNRMYSVYLELCSAGPLASWRKSDWQDAFLEIIKFRHIVEFITMSTPI